jgi:flagellar protein FliS
VDSASPEQILIMLYDAAIKDIRVAQEAIEANDRGQKAKALDHGVKVIMELINSLRPEKAPEIAENLRRLYDFMIDRMIQANLKNDVEQLEPVVKVLIELREAWVEAIRMQRANRNSGVLGA